MLLRAMEGEVKKALTSVLERVSAAAAQRSPEVSALCPTPRLVAVSKTKGKEVVVEAYRAGQRHFGENYIQELLAKATDEEVVAECPDIKWHIIGPVQKKNIKKVVSVPNLYCVETIHSARIASALNKALQGCQTDRLKVFIQVNTSNEESKSGVAPSQTPSLYQHIQESCPNLHPAGLMTIGAFTHDLTNGPNPDFQRLLRCRSEVCETCGVKPSDVELSMGMSSDFEHAILVGSTNVRVGSTIFGAREPKK